MNRTTPPEELTTNGQKHHAQGVEDPTGSINFFGSGYYLDGLDFTYYLFGN